MTPQEILSDRLTTRQLGLLRLSADVERRVIKLLTSLLADVQAKIIRQADAKKIAAMDALISDINKILAPFGAVLFDIIDPRSITTAEIRFTTDAINKSLGASVATAISASAAVKIADTTLINGLPILDIMQGFSDKLKTEIAQQIRLGFASGETIPDMAHRVRDLTGMKENHAITTARTMVNAISNHARMATYEENADLIQGYIQNSTLDSRTTLTCAVRDNLAWDKEKQPVGHDQVFAIPPLHPRCRSVIMPWFYPASKLPKDKRDKLTTGTRASMDGEQPQAITFENWFEKKPAEFQEKYLGLDRYTLYKSGKISFGDLVDMTGRPLTLQELENL